MQATGLPLQAEGKTAGDNASLPDIEVRYPT